MIAYRATVDVPRKLACFVARLLAVERRRRGTPRNALFRSLRCLGERGFALITGRWRTLQHVTASPSKIGDIARAALVLTHFEHGYIK